jgi:hypothetical protein
VRALRAKAQNDFCVEGIQDAAILAAKGQKPEPKST